MTRLAPGLTIGFKTTPQGVDLPTLDATWRVAGTLGVFDAGWVTDHLTDANRERGGSSLEPMTLLAGLAHHVPGLWLGTAVLSNTFRHPSMLAKQATVLDNLAGGRFVLGLGAGWHVGEHETFGIPLPPPTERFDRYESTLRVLRALFSDAARTPPGVDLDDPFAPLRGATNEPPTVRAGGPLIWLGGQKRRGIELAVRYADGWPMPGNMSGDVAYFAAKRDEIRRARPGRLHVRRAGRRGAGCSRATGFARPLRGVRARGRGPRPPASVVRALTIAQGGTVGLRSAAPSGALFWMDLPAAAPSSPATGSPAPA